MENEANDDIQFNVPDLVVEYSLSTGTVTLEAFKVMNNRWSQYSSWVSVGYPLLVENSEGNIFDFTSEAIVVKIRTLDNLQKEALVKNAKLQYEDQTISTENIIQLPLQQFTCTIRFLVNGTEYTMRGSVYAFNKSPLQIKFPYSEGHETRRAFETRIRNEKHLVLECELSAAGKQEKVNTLTIDANQMQSLDLMDKLMGPANECYVVRNQLSQMAQEIRTNMKIKESYEIEGEEFSEEFIQTILENSRSTFEQVAIDIALQQLSKYGVSHDQKDLSPDEIKRELSNILVVKNFGGKQKIVASDSYNDKSKSSVCNNREASLKVGYALISGEPAVNFTKSKSNEWDYEAKTARDQLLELNTHSKDNVKFEIEGNRVVPKSMEVAKVTRTSLNQQFAFTRVKKRLSGTKYLRTFELNTNENPSIVSENNYLREQYANYDKKLTEMQKQLQFQFESQLVALHKILIDLVNELAQPPVSWIASPNFPAFYPPNANVKWGLVAGAGNINVIFFFFETESDEDFVRFYAGNSVHGRLLNKFSVDYGKATLVCFDEKDVLMQFTSHHNSNKNGGFLAAVTGIVTQL